jgi:hypothetical protein
MQIGRVGLDGLVLLEPDEWVESAGGVVQTGGWLRDLSVAELRWQRGQLLGLLTGDESEVPVRLGAADDDRDGWYRVLDARVENVLGVSEVSGARRWSATLQRRALGTARRLELVRTGSVRTNDHGVGAGSARALVAFPDGVNSTAGIDLGVSSGTYSDAVRDCDDPGNVRIYTEGVSESTLYNNVAAALVRLDAAYDGRCRIEALVGGVWREVVGRENITPTNWRVSNGHFRVGRFGAGTAAWWSMEVFNGTAWVGSADTYTFRLQPLVEERHLAVIYNSPERCTLRVTGGTGSANSRSEIDVTIKRGMRHVSCSWYTRAASQKGVRARRPAASAISVTDLPSKRGFHSAADAGNFRWAMMSPALWVDPPPDALTSESWVELQRNTNAQRFNFGLAAALASGTGPIEQAANEYYAEVNELQRVGR